MTKQTEEIGINNQELKAIIVFGEKVEEEVVQVKSMINKVKIENIEIIGDGKKTINMEEVNDFLVNRRDRISEETLFIVSAHGVGIDGWHYIDDQISVELVTAMGKMAGMPINVILFSCHAGAALKGVVPEDNISHDSQYPVRKKIKGIKENSLTTFAGSKYRTLGVQATNSILHAINLITLGVDKNTIIHNLIATNPETVYHLSPESSLLPIKFSRAGKFLLSEIGTILRKSYSSSSSMREKEIDEILERLEKTNKKDFSLHRIKEELDIKNDPLNPALRDPKYVDFINAMREELSKKLTASEIKSYMESRAEDFPFRAGNLSIDEKKENAQDYDLLEKIFIMFLSRGSVEEVLIILKKNPELINVTGLEGGSALMYAAASRQEKVVEMLIKAGANINLQNNKGWSALMCAADDGQEKVVKILIKAGANIHLQDSNGKSALMFAAEAGQEEVVEILIKAGANINLQANDGRSALMFATHKDHEGTVEKLIAAGTVINLKNNSGDTALDIAKKDDHKNIITMLEQKEKIFEKSVLDINLALRKTLKKSNIETIVKIVKDYQLRYKGDLPEEVTSSPPRIDHSKNKFSIFSSSPVKYRPILTRLLIHSKDAETIKYLSDNLNHFISNKNLFSKDYKSRDPLNVAITRALGQKSSSKSQDLFIEIAAKLVIKMKQQYEEKKEGKQEESLEQFILGRYKKLKVDKIIINKINSDIERITKLQREDFKTKISSEDSKVENEEETKVVTVYSVKAKSPGSAPSGAASSSKVVEEKKEDKEEIQR